MIPYLLNLCLPHLLREVNEEYNLTFELWYGNIIDNRTRKLYNYRTSKRYIMIFNKHCVLAGFLSKNH